MKCCSASPWSPGRRGQDAEHAPDRTLAEGRAPGDDRQALIGKQQLVEPPAARHVAEEGGGLGEQRERDHPLRVERQVVEPARGERLEHRPRLAGVPELGVRPGQRAAPGRDRRVALDQLAERRQRLLESAQVLGPLAMAAQL